MKCFEHSKHFKHNCQKNNCRYWVNCSEDHNCAILLSKSDQKLTLEDVGKLFDVTRMRICQIEKTAIKKLKEKIDKES